jgi:DHA1 family inner membrane transport protein
VLVDNVAQKSGTALPIISMIVFTILAAAVYVILPMLVGATVEVLGFTAKQAGFIAAADMLGASFSALIVSSLISQGHWRRIIVCAIGILTIANVLSGLASHFFSLFLCRILAGWGEGALLAVGNASIGETHNPDRVFGLSTAGQVAFGSPALYLMPSLLAVYGLRGVFWSLAALTVASTILVRHMPDRARQGAELPTASANRRLSKQSVLGLAGVFTYFIAQGGVWAYLDRIGAVNQIEAANIGKALAISSIGGLLGALLASWLNIRLGRMKPLLLATLCSVVSLIILNLNATFIAYAAMASLFNSAWNFSVPYEFGALSLIDTSRRTVALGGVVVFGGLTVGPVIAASIISDTNLHNIAWMGISFCVLSLVIFGRLLVPIERDSFS